MGINNPLFTDYSEQKMYHTDVYLFGECYRFQVIIVLQQQKISRRKECQRGRLCRRVNGFKKGYATPVPDVA